MSSSCNKSHLPTIQQPTAAHLLRDRSRWFQWSYRDVAGQLGQRIEVVHNLTEAKQKNQWIKQHGMEALLVLETADYEAIPALLTQPLGVNLVFRGDQPLPVAQALCRPDPWLDRRWQTLCDEPGERLEISWRESPLWNTYGKPLVVG